MGNDLSPAYIKYHYTANAHQHVMTLPTKLAGAITPGEEPHVLNHDNSESLASVFISDLTAVLVPFLKTTDSFGVWEVWSKPLPSDDPVFIFAASDGSNGTDTAINQPATEAVFSWRTAHKGGLKIYLMEGTTPPNVRFAIPPDGAAQVIALDTFVRSDACALYARNNDAPLVMLSYIGKVNDVLRRKYLTG